MQSVEESREGDRHVRFCRRPLRPSVGGLWPFLRRVPGSTVLASIARAIRTDPAQPLISVVKRLLRTSAGEVQNRGRMHSAPRFR